MNIEKELKKYNNYKYEIETLESRIRMLESINAEELEYIEVKNKKKGIIKRPTENQAIHSELNKKSNKEFIRKDILTATTNIAIIKNKKETLENAIKTLFEEEEYIIKCKYMHKMTYDCILANMQSNKFKNKSTN